MPKKLLLIVLTAIIYWVLVNYIPYGTYVILPVNLFVTFLHEFGHSFFALITGGNVHEVMVYSNGAGYAVTSGGFSPLILMGGYIGSAVFGNLLLHVGLCKPKVSIFILYFFVGVLIFTSIWWFSSLFTSIVLLVFAAVAVWISKRSKATIANILIIIGTVSVVFIVRDYNVGPSSDIAKFSEEVSLLPQAVWAVVWLLIVLYITYSNLKISFANRK